MCGICKEGDNLESRDFLKHKSTWSKDYESLEFCDLDDEISIHIIFVCLKHKEK